MLPAAQRLNDATNLDAAAMNSAANGAAPKGCWPNMAYDPYTSALVNSIDM